MYCKKCGAALPSTGFVCRSCGAMMSEEQIKEQKKMMASQDHSSVYLKSDQYTGDTIKRNYYKRNENKYLGAIFIVLVVLILIILAILKVM